MSQAVRILIVGGYGTFGGRIVELLEGEPRLTLIVAGRSLSKAESFCAGRKQARAVLVPALFDRDGDVASQLAACDAYLLVDASGPFQDYGEGCYRLIEACIGAGVHYLDLADGSAFVRGVKVFDGAARSAGVYVLSGVSSFPVLTAAVVRRLAVDMKEVTAIRGGIAPSPYAGVGENVIRAIAGYAGRPISMKRDGKATTGYPFTEHVSYTIAPPGRVPLRRTLFSLIDVPDLGVLAEQWPEARSVWMGAAPVPEILHRALIVFARLVRWRVLPSLSFLAPLMHVATNRVRWGEHRGGMFVEVEGVGRDGASMNRSWHLLAEGRDGPLIPSMAVEALVRRVLAGRMPESGARAAVSDLELGDYDALFKHRSIATGIRDKAADKRGPLYARVLGSAWNELPHAIREMHSIDGTGTADGRATVQRGAGILSRIAAAVIGFPKARADTSVSVRFEVRDNIETWTRTFGDDRFSSRQFAGDGRSHGLICEQFGPLTFAMAVVLEGERLVLVLRRWSAFGIPLPLWFAPRSSAYEESNDGVFRFFVEISHPLTGLIVRYQGWLRPGSSIGLTKGAASVADRGD